MKAIILKIAAGLIMVALLFSGCTKDKLNPENENVNHNNEIEKTEDEESAGEKDASADKGTTEDELGSAESEDASDTSESEEEEEKKDEEVNGSTDSGNTETDAPASGENDSSEKDTGTKDEVSENVTDLSNKYDASEEEILLSCGIGVYPNDENMSGDGSQASPYEIIPSVNGMYFYTKDIQPGEIVCYAVQRVEKMCVIIENENAFVIDADGIRHDAVEGKVMAVLATGSIQIGNSGNAEEGFKVYFVGVEGTYGKPKVISEFSEEGQFVHLEEGNDTGYYYKYYAQKDGVIRFYIKSITEGVEGSISVTNNRSYANRTITAEGDYFVDEDGRKYIEVEVEKGDELLIILCACPDRRFNYPEADITWIGVYTD